MRAAIILTVILALVLPVVGFAVPTIVVRNNHDFDYAGPVSFKTTLTDGLYKGSGGEAIVVDGVASATVHVKGSSSVTLQRVEAGAFAPLLISYSSISGGMTIHNAGNDLGRVEFGLAVIPGKVGTFAQAVASFNPLDITFTQQHNGTYLGKATVGDYQVEMTLDPNSGGWLDCQAKITYTSDKSDPVYLALIRKVTMPDVTGVKTDWNGVIMNGTDDPAITDRIATLTKGVDWCSWKSGGLSWAAVNQFSAGYTCQDSKGKWIPANHFYTWEKAADKDGSIYLVSEVAGANLSQDNGKYMGVRAYCPPQKNEPVILKWRLAMAQSPKADWEKSQLYVTAGYRNVIQMKDKAVVDLGVPYVEFGTSYFPYSTMTENFDYYRTADLDREGWWPFSPKMWENWKAFQPQMATDIRIIKAMGFDYVRLHHLELLGEMDRKNAFAFLDFYMGECRKLGLKVLFDTAGSDEWVCSVVGRYKDVVKFVEIENEILIPGIPKGAPERWTGQYNAVKKVAPNTQAFLTGACNQGMFDRLTYLGVPFDRIGFHNYKHGAAFDESIPSVMLGVANQATDYGKPAVLGEFNWKLLTAWSPEARGKEVGKIYAKMLEPRAIPNIFQFHWQETMSVNPRLTRQGIRHYETINLDRTPKPEALELMSLIRKYANPSSPVRALPIAVTPVAMSQGGTVSVPFSIANKTVKPVSVKLSVESFQGLTCKLTTKAAITLKPREKCNGMLNVLIAKDALPGTYHYFVKAESAGGSSYGWGTVRKQGAPKFDAPVMPDLVEYVGGADIVNKFDYSKPICIVFAKDCPIVEMEMAYQLRNTLQCATGRFVYLCSTPDVPKSYTDSGNLILIGTFVQTQHEGARPLDTGKGMVILDDKGNGRQWLYLAGVTTDEVRAAATDFVLRFWKNAKDSTSRISGLEKGAALGSKIPPGEVNMP